MQVLLSDQEISYTGPNLRSGWIQQQFGLQPPAAVAWMGPCHVATVDLVDLEDQAVGAEIHAARMLHLVAEHPGPDLFAAVLRQRLLVALARELLADEGLQVRRRGDDLYVAERKLSVSIAAPSPTSCLLHLGLNVDPAGAPVPAIGLGELGVEPASFARRLLEAYREEVDAALAACRKVRNVP
jgi:hypothetical protein